MNSNPLKNRVAFCDLVAHASFLGVPGAWSGSSFRYHPRGVYREGMLFTNHWHTSNYCDIRIAENPSAKLVLGCQNPRANGDPIPKPDNGKWVKVWSGGEWILEGPWQEKAERLLFEIAWDVRAASIRKRASQITAARARSEEKANHLQALKQAWA